MQSETKKQSFIGIWSGSVAVVCLALMLGLVSTGYGEILIGNFESADSNDGWVPGWEGSPVLTKNSTTGVTLDGNSLAVQWNVKYWVLQWNAPSDILAELPTSLAGYTLKFDLTALPTDFADGSWAKVADKIALNSDSASGWQEWENVATAKDRHTGASTGLDWGIWSGVVSRTYSFVIPEYDLTDATYFQINITAQLSINGVETGTGKFYLDNVRLIPQTVVDIKKCTVTAGKTQYADDNDFNNMKDTFTASGNILLPTNIDDINTVAVAITSVTDGYLVYSEDLNDFNATDVNNSHKYTHKAKLIKGKAGKITSLTLDFHKIPGTFAITAKNIDLTGLASPLELKFTMGSHDLHGQADETIINGKKTTIPTRLMRMYKDTLLIPPGKTKVKNSTKASSDSLSVKGEIAVEDINATDPNLYALPVVISWSSADDTNSQTFTIPEHSFKIPKKGGHLYTLNKKITPDVAPVPDSNTKVSGTIDLDKCTFALSITKADINAVSGQTKFGISFDTPHGEFDEVNDVNLVWKK